ncbi:AAA family ATPase [Candidatus Amarolinea dominans]|uniref:ATP-binding protein n=1 Tax=Candidatus Amarolinea dominans TaxID=3140696 RepID=UPI00313574DB|nr:AAA family ATPase [Anaerolineae bacterium]
MPALEIENEPETIARLLALCEQAQPLPAATLPAPVPSRPGAEPQPAPPNRLPVRTTSFIGRAANWPNCRNCWPRDQTRLLTLTGAGGCGKTRLALRVGEGMAHAYSHGVWLVELAALTDPRLLVREVASTFDLQENAERPLLAALADFLRPRQALLILDNCEHLVDVAARLAAALLQACPDLRILATSRENLAVPGEIVYPVQPLALPPALLGGRPGRADVEGYDAIRLFVERARAVLRLCPQRPERRPSPHLPAAGRHPPGYRTGRGLAAPAFTGGNRGPAGTQSRSACGRTADPPAPPPNPGRGHCVELPSARWRGAGAAAPSFHLWRRLVPGSRRRNRRGIAAPGPGGCAGAAATTDQQIPGDGGALRRKRTRYRFLEAIREFARQRLAESGEEAALADRHLAWFVALAERAEPRLKSAQQLFWLAALDQEQENFRAALSHSLARGSVEEGLRLVGAGPLLGDASPSGRRRPLGRRTALTQRRGAAS